MKKVFMPMVLISIAIPYICLSILYLFTVYEQAEMQQFRIETAYYIGIIISIFIGVLLLLLIFSLIKIERNITIGVCILHCLVIIVLMFYPTHNAMIYTFVTSNISILSIFLGVSCSMLCRALFLRDDTTLK